MANRITHSPHQLVLSVRRDEGDGVLGLELAELDALMELAIIDGDGALRPGRLVPGFSWMVTKIDHFGQIHHWKSTRFSFQTKDHNKCALCRGGNQFYTQ